MATRVWLIRAMMYSTLACMAEAVFWVKGERGQSCTDACPKACHEDVQWWPRSQADFMAILLDLGEDHCETITRGEVRYDPSIDGRSCGYSQWRKAHINFCNVKPPLSASRFCPCVGSAELKVQLVPSSSYRVSGDCRLVSSGSRQVLSSALATWCCKHEGVACIASDNKEIVAPEKSEELLNDMRQNATQRQRDQADVSARPPAPRQLWPFIVPAFAVTLSICIVWCILKNCGSQKAREPCLPRGHSQDALLADAGAGQHAVENLVWQERTIHASKCPRSCNSLIHAAFHQTVKARQAGEVAGRRGYDVSTVSLPDSAKCDSRKISSSIHDVLPLEPFGCADVRNSSSKFPEETSRIGKKEHNMELTPECSVRNDTGKVEESNKKPKATRWACCVSAMATEPPLGAAQGR